MAAEFILPLKVDIAAAKMPEISSPTIPTGNWVKIYHGKMASPLGILILRFSGYTL